MKMIEIGAVANTHGLNGTFKIKSFTDFVSERYQKGSKIYLHYKGEYLELTVVKYKTTKGVELVDFEEYNNINQIEQFKGCKLYVKEEDLHQLNEDEFYFNELLKMEVYTDRFIGHVIDIREVPQGQLLVVKREKQKNALIPFLKHFVNEIDKKNNKITITNWEGLL